uniref:Putative Zn2Cys6 DNA-binding transcription factor n=1 Tax=Fusarium aywerte TaxID=427292 RepID=A0A1Y0B9M8_9HYPO|nr:putative Zn2Cys6 DNA-binding transcription factor [Fusarium aywerte]
MIRPSPGSASLTARHACEICRERKVRCDRALPKCRRCERLNQLCVYSPISHRRTRDEQLQELQERLAKTEAQLALDTSRRRTSSMSSQSRSDSTAPVLPSLGWPDTVGSATSDMSAGRLSQYQLPAITTPRIPSVPASVSHSSASDSMDMLGSKNANTIIDLPANSPPMLDIDLFNAEADTNMALDWNPFLTVLEPLDNLLPNRISPSSLPQNGTEEDISAAELNAMHNCYFESIYFSFPFLNRDRFIAESTGSGPAINALVYAVALAGGAHSSCQYNKVCICYTLARNYAERCEREGQLDDLNFLQALLFIGRFEAMDGKVERSWMTLGRAAMLSRLLRLPQMDRVEEATGRQDGSGLNMVETTDPVLLEERRRTFWALYILQSYITTRTGWQCILGDIKDFQINLPSPGLLRSDLTPLKMPYLSEVGTKPCPEVSSYAGCVLMVELALRCLDHGQWRGKASFWDGYCVLVKDTDELFGMLKQHLNANSIRKDPVAFSLYLNLRATEIFSHESAIGRSKEQGLPPLMTAESQRRATAAAFHISTAVRLNLPSPWKVDSDIIMLQAIFIAWPLTMALKAFCRELEHGGSRDSVNGVVTSSRLLFAALGHIEESGGHWHKSVAHVEAKLQELEEKNGFNSLALQIHCGHVIKDANILDRRLCINEWSGCWITLVSACGMYFLGIESMYGTSQFSKHPISSHCGRIPPARL